jgi:error-prone DNA polymerase
MGFYQPAQIVRDAQAHGVEVRPIDINHSRWNCTLEPGANTQGHAIRLGMRMVKSLSEKHASAIAHLRERGGSYQSIDELRRRTRAEVPIEALRHLARADAFGSIGVSRQAALWTLQRLVDQPLPLFDEAADPAGITQDTASAAALPVPSAFDEVAADYDRAQLSLKAHPISFVREQLEHAKVTPCHLLSDPALTPAGRTVAVAGLVLVRQRPGTAFGIVFMTIEDETGIANLVLFPKIYERFRAVARHSAAIVCIGKVERQGPVVHIKASRLRSLPLSAPGLHGLSRDFH